MTRVLFDTDIHDRKTAFLAHGGEWSPVERIWANTVPHRNDNDSARPDMVLRLDLQEEHGGRPLTLTILFDSAQYSGIRQSFAGRIEYSLISFTPRVLLNGTPVPSCTSAFWSITPFRSDLPCFYRRGNVQINLTFDDPHGIARLTLSNSISMISNSNDLKVMWEHYGPEWINFPLEDVFLIGSYFLIKRIVFGQRN